MVDLMLTALWLSSLFTQITESKQADNQRGQTERLKSFRIFHVRCCLYPHVKEGYDRRSTYNKGSAHPHRVFHWL